MEFKMQNRNCKTDYMALTTDKLLEMDIKKSNINKRLTVPES